MLHRLLDSRASCGVRRPPHSSGCCPLGSSMEAVEASGVFGESGVCLGVMETLAAIRALPLLTCLECVSLGPAVLCCLSPLASYQALIVRVTPPGPLMPLWMSIAMCLAGDLWCPCLLLPFGCSGGCLRLSHGGTVSVSRADSSPLWVHTVCPCVGGPPALMSSCAHCHSASRAGQCNHQGCCQRESSATTIARADPTSHAGCCAPSSLMAGLLGSPWSSSLSRRARLLRVVWVEALTDNEHTEG